MANSLLINLKYFKPAERLCFITAKLYTQNCVSANIDQIYTLPFALRFGFRFLEQWVNRNT